MKTISIQCNHWKPSDPGSGLCSLGLHGGKPSIGTCLVCEHYGAPGNAPVDPRILENIRRQHGPCKGCGD